MKIVADTSALISLAIADLIKKSLEIVEIYIPKEVVLELTELSKYKDIEGSAARAVLELVGNKKIIVKEIKNQQKIENILNSDIHHGEAACFALCAENDIQLFIMDDVDAGYSLESIAKSHGLEIRISIAVIVELYSQNKINKTETKNAIKSLTSRRRWESGALEVLAKKYMDIL